MPRERAPTQRPLSGPFDPDRPDRADRADSVDGLDGTDDGRVALRVEHELFIRSFFELRPPERMVAQLAAGLRDVLLPAGVEIYHQGDAAENLYFLIRGEVSLEADGEEPWVFGPQSMLGVLDASMGRPYSRTARVLRDASALTMSFREYVDVLEDHFDYTKSSLELGCRTMHERSLSLPAELVFDSSGQGSEALVAHDAALELIDRVMVLRRCEVLHRTSVQALVTLAKHVEVERWQPGEVLFTAGAAAPHLRLIAGGRIRIERQAPPVHARFGPGELLLRQAAIGADHHAYTAIAETPAVVLRLSKEDLFDVAEDHFSLIGSLYSYLSRENERTRRLIAERRAAVPGL